MPSNQVFASSGWAAKLSLVPSAISLWDETDAPGPRASIVTCQSPALKVSLHCERSVTETGPQSAFSQPW